MKYPVDSVIPNSISVCILAKVRFFYPFFIWIIYVNYSCYASDGDKCIWIFCGNKCMRHRHFLLSQFGKTYSYLRPNLTRILSQKFHHSKDLAHILLLNILMNESTVLFSVYVEHSKCELCVPQFVTKCSLYLCSNSRIISFLQNFLYKIYWKFAKLFNLNVDVFGKYYEELEITRNHLRIV